MGEHMVFVVGARRSGTNWLQRVLCTHPDVIGTHGESFLFSRGLVPLMGRFHHGSPSARELGSVFVDRERMIGAIRGVCDVVFGDLRELLGPADRLVDRTPEHVTCLDLIGEVYPEARVIHIIRDGRDVVRSLLSMEWGTQEAEVAAEEWRAAVVDGRKQGASLRHYREVRYESLLSDPARGFSDTFVWLGLDVDHDVISAAMEEANRAFTVDPKMATIASGKWREGLDPEALAVLERVAGGALEELGYTDDGSEPAPVTQSPDAVHAVQTSRSGGRSRIGGVAAALVDRATRRGRSHGGGAEWQMRERLHVGSQLVNSVLSALAVGSDDQLRPLLDDGVAVRLLGGAHSGYEGRGPDARELLLDVLGSDPVLRWRQRPGAVHSGVPTTTVFLSYEGPDATVEHRVLALTITGDRVSGVTYLHPGVG